MDSRYFYTTESPSCTSTPYTSCSTSTQSIGEMAIVWLIVFIFGMIALKIADINDWMDKE
jgi:hypothetical protein